MILKGPRPTQRRRRLAVTLVLSGLFTYSGAGAQSDKDWVETALERTLRLSAPWELPLSPQLEPTSAPEELLAPELSPDADLVLEVPWGQANPEEAKTDSPLVVHPVDHLEDPWVQPSAESAPSPAAQAPEEEPPQPSPYGQSMLIDPWAD